MKNVLIVFGGKSYEHDISVITASQIFNKTKLEDIRLMPLYFSRDEKFYLYESKEFDVKDFSINKFVSSSKKFKEMVFVSGEYSKLFIKTRFGLKQYIECDDVIFACHGGSGENGKLTSFFEQFKFGVSSGNSLALSLCMNKFLFKQTMKGLKIPVVSGFKISKFEYENEFEKYKTRLKFLKFPVIIKSNNGGSSIGLFVVNKREDFESNLKMAFEFDNEVLIEKFCENAREFNVAIIGDADKFVVTEIDEPVKENDVLSFADKYLSNQKTKGVKRSGLKSMASQKRKFPADISKELNLKIKNIAGKIFKNLGLSGVVRIDFLYEESKDKLYVCEVNAVPGSLAYYFFKENRVSVNDLVLKLISICEKNKTKFVELKKDLYIDLLG